MPNFNKHLIQFTNGTYVILFKFQNIVVHDISVQLVYRHIDLLFNIVSDHSKYYITDW